MATTAKASEHIKPCNIAQSERHNRRDADYIASLNPAMLYIRKDLAHLNEVYVAPDMVGVSLQQHIYFPCCAPFAFLVMLFWFIFFLFHFAAKSTFLQKVCTTYCLN